jgi:hypothetical protein
MRGLDLTSEDRSESGKCRISVTAVLVGSGDGGVEKWRQTSYDPVSFCNIKECSSFLWFLSIF